jgi:hypothetical protein
MTRTYEEAEKFCEEFARKHEIQFTRYGVCGFGRHCSGFSKDGTWIAYHPTKATYKGRDVNPSSWDDVPEFSKAALWAPSGVESYHKDNYLCVLHGGGGIDPDEFAKMFGTTEQVIEATPDREKPRTPQMEKAVVQLAEWIDNMEATATALDSELFVGMYENGYRGLQAFLSGSISPAIGVR